MSYDNFDNFDTYRVRMSIFREYIKFSPLWRETNVTVTRRSHKSVFTFERVVFFSISQSAIDNSCTVDWRFWIALFEEVEQATSELYDSMKSKIDLTSRSSRMIIFVSISCKHYFEATKSSDIDARSLHHFRNSESFTSRIIFCCNSILS